MHSCSTQSFGLRTECKPLLDVFSICGKQDAWQNFVQKNWHRRKKKAIIYYFRKAASNINTPRDSCLHLRLKYWYLIIYYKAETSISAILEEKLVVRQMVLLFVQNLASLPIIFSLQELRKRPFKKLNYNDFSKWQSIVMQVELH